MCSYSLIVTITLTYWIRPGIISTSSRIANIISGVNVVLMVQAVKWRHSRLSAPLSASRALEVAGTKRFVPSTINAWCFDSIVNEETRHRLIPKWRPKQAVDRKKAHETRQGRKVLQPNNGHRVRKEMNGKVVQCNNQNTKGKVIFVEYDDSTISSYDGGSDDESYASGSYYTSDLAYLNDKFDQWLDRIAGIPDKRKRRSKY